MVLAVSSMIKTRWKLRAFMAQHKIKNTELAVVMKKHPTTIARLKATDKMPMLDGDTLDQLCDALTKLLQAKEGSHTVVKLFDLIEFYEAS